MLDKLGSQARVERPVVEMNPWLGRVGLFIAVGVAYFLAAQLGLALLTTAERVAVFWPASGLAVGIQIALGPGARWPVAAGVIAATLAANLMGDRSVWGALAFGLCNAGETLLAMWLIERWFGPAFNLETLRRVVGFFAAAAIATAMAALGAAGAMQLFGPPTAEFLAVWQIWFRSDALGLVTVAPLLVGVAATVRDVPSWRELLEGTLGVVAVAVVNGITLVLLAGPWSLMAPAVFLFPLLLWIGSRCRPVFAAAAAFSVAAAIVWTTIHGFGRYGDPSPALADRVLAAQVTMLGITLAALAVAALFAERRKAELALAEREAQLGLAGKAALVGSFAVDIATGTVHNSAGYAAIHGLPEGTEEFPREQWRARVHPDDLPRLDALRSQAFAERRREHKTEYRLPSADGSVQWIESRGLITYDDDGCPTRLVGVNIDMTERKRAQAALEESEARYRALYDDNPSMYFTVDASGTVLSVNEFGARQLGYTPAELVGQSVLQMIHEGDREQARRWLASCTENAGTVARAEMRKIRRDGSIIWVRKLARAVNNFGRPTLLIVCEDITERKEAESALAERETQLALAGRTARVASFVVDYTTGRVQTSPGYAAIHDLAEGTEEITREQWRARIPPDDLARLDALRSQVFAERRGELNIDYRIIGPGGKVQWIESRGLVFYDADGHPTRLVGIHIDITERKRAEDRLQASECKLRDLLGALPAAIYVTDAEGQIIYCNQSAVDLWGTKPALGKDKWNDMVKFYHADGSPMALADCPTEVALKEGRITRGQEAIIERKDGTRIPIIPYPTPLRDETGAIVGVVNMTVDISERKKAELALAERNIQLGLAGKAALVGSWAYDTDMEIMRISEGYAAIHGFTEGSVEIPRNQCLATVHSDDIEWVRQVRSEAFSGRRREYSVEYRIFRPGGERRWVETRCFITYDDEGRPRRVVGVSIDITERKQVEEQQVKLVAELDHRVKNVLATVQAVAGHTMRTNSSIERFVAALDGRIRSMGSTHELLSHRRWAGIPLAELVQRELAPYTTGTNTVKGGPDVTLSAEAGQAMGMVLHELVTNAAKHGALSVPSGRVSIEWRLPFNGGANDHLVLKWRETGGPVVVPGSKSGYGMDVVRSVIPYELGGTVDYVLAPEGVQCRIEIPFTLLSGGATGSKEPGPVEGSNTKSASASRYH